MTSTKGARRFIYSQLTPLTTARDAKRYERITASFYRGGVWHAIADARTMPILVSDLLHADLPHPETEETIIYPTGAGDGDRRLG